MQIRNIVTAAMIALLPVSTAAASSSLRGSPASMSRQHTVALNEELTFYKTFGAVLAEVVAGALTPLKGNADYRIANVSFGYAVPEVRMLVERLAAQYRSACGEQLVVTSLTRPQIAQPRNAHALSVHPAGMAVDLRISERASCRSWLESTLLALEEKQVLDVTREHRPPHYHVAVFPTAYREYAAGLDALEKAFTPPPVVRRASVMNVVRDTGDGMSMLNYIFEGMSMIDFIISLATAGLLGLSGILVKRIFFG